MIARLFDRGLAAELLPYIAIVLCGAILAVILIETDAFERLYLFTRIHEGWELDELLIAGFATLVALLAMTVIRVWREAGRRRHEETRLHNLVRHDPLTGLPNRMYLEEELLRRIGDGRRLGTRFAVVILHLEGIDQVIDLQGHQAGDDVLRTVAGRLRNLLRDHDLATRLTGNEFALLISADDDTDGLAVATRRIRDLVNGPITFDTFTATLTTSLGVAVFPDDAGSREKLLQHASVAVHRSRATAGNATTFYDPQFNADQRQRAELKAEIVEALNSRQFIPFFQPWMGLRNGRLAGLEALARWNHPTRGMLPPRDFISAAEETGLIADLFWDILRQACATARAWPETVPVAVNLSPVQLADEHFAQTLLTTLRAEAFKPDRLVIEITENTLVGDTLAVREAMGRLKRHGIRFSLDDFGTGYSSLHYLSQLPFDTIKIDKSFIRGFHRENGTYQIVSSIIKLCRSLGLKTTAEGVETKDEAAELEILGCTYGQGYLFSAPLHAAAADRVVRQSTDRYATGPRQGCAAATGPMTRFEA